MYVYIFTYKIYIYKILLSVILTGNIVLYQLLNKSAKATITYNQFHIYYT